MPVIFESLVTIFCLTLLYLYFRFMRRVDSRSHSWAILTVLEDQNLLMWILLKLEVDFDLDLIRS